MEKQLSCCWYRYVKIFFLFYIRIEFLPGHASITLDPRCKVPTGQHILSIGPGYGLAPNATVTAEVSNKTIVMLWMLSYITVYYLTSSKLEWNKDSLQRGECWVTADAEYAVVLVLSKLAFFPSCPWHISSKPAWTSVSLQANILYWFAPRWCVTLLQPLRPALISHLEFVPAGPDVSLNKVPSSLLKCTPSNEVSIPSTHLPNEKFMCFFFLTPPAAVCGNRGASKCPQCSAATLLAHPHQEGRRGPNHHARRNHCHHRHHCPVSTQTGSQSR